MVCRIYSLLSSFCQCQFNLAVAKTIKSYLIPLIPYAIVRHLSSLFPDVTIRKLRPSHISYVGTGFGQIDHVAQLFLGKEPAVLTAAAWGRGGGKTILSDKLHNSYCC